MHARQGSYIFSLPEYAYQFEKCDINFASGDSRLGNEPAASPDQTNECLILSTLQCQLWGRAI